MLNTILLSLTMAAQLPADSIPVLSDSLKEDVVVRAVKADVLMPVTQFNYSKTDIKERYYGQDIAYIIQNSPSIVSQSDAGNGFGYSFIRMRGMDYSRINFNINGIPVNDAETQGFFTNNFGDLASSAQSIQIQRGVGATSYGTAPFAGSIGIVTNDLKGPTSFGATLGYGSYNSKRVTAEYSSGMLYNKFAFYGRLSSLQSDGYRTHSGTDLKTYFVSGAYFGKKSILKFNAFGGSARSQLAYLPVADTTLAKNRRANPMSGNETDEFQQNFYQLQYSYKFNSRLSLSSSAYYVSGNAPRFAIALLYYYTSYYTANMPNVNIPVVYDSVGTKAIKDSLITSTNMLVSYRLKQDFYGGFAFLNYTASRLNLTLGVHVNAFKSNHFMEILSADVFPIGYSQGQIAYSNTGYKQEISSFAKGSYYITDKFIAFADLQLRYAAFQYRAKDMSIYRDTYHVDDMSWLFLNPKAGLRYLFTKNLSAFGSIGRTSREPTRTDYLVDDRAGQDVYQNDIKPETVTDIEFGGDYKTEKIKISINAYFMEFQNEIAATGEYNSFGYFKRKNASSSFRRGVEVSASVKALPWLLIYNNSSFSYNRIKQWNQTYSDTTITYNNVQPVLTPSVIINQGLRFMPFDWLYADISGRYVSKSYLDNTGNEKLTAPDYLIFDFSAGIKFKKWLKYGDHSLVFHANNFTNTKYYPAGSPSHAFVAGVETATPNYFAAATRNFFVTLQLKF